MSILTFDAVSFHYPTNHKQVIENLTLSLPQGAVSAILGPNGAGKTTLLHLALGWLKPQSGRILLHSRPLESYTRRELGQQIGLVPQTEQISFEYTLLEYVLLGRAPYLPPLQMPTAQDCRLALHALEQVGLAEQANRSILKLSGGERQLALLARALVQQPSLILMDEPTAHLDLGNKRRLLDILRILLKRGISVVLTTHEPDFAAAIATYLVLVGNGRVYEAGPLNEVFTSGKISSLYHVPVRILDLDGKKLLNWTTGE